MKIISYNVNGIRSAIAKGLFKWLESVDVDVVCLQEIKAMESQIEIQEFEKLGFKYNYIFSAEKKGYSGVAIFSKIEPKNVEVGSKIDYMDKEGRILRADFDNISVMSLYLPSGTNPDRLGFKFTFMDDFQNYINNLKKQYPNLVICGDYNICHREIDIHDPVRNAKVSGFLPEERAWLDGFINSGFLDSFRMFNTEANNYSWWSYRANAREKNKGWRIDYCLVDQRMKDRVKRALILPMAKHSDHCPVMVEID